MTPEQGAALGEAIAERIIGSDRGLRILPYYLGGFFDHFLLGIVVSQFLIYVPFIKTDKRLIVGFVFAAVSCTVAATIDIMLWLTKIFVWEYGSFMSFADGHFIHRYIIIDMVSTFVVQCFYVDRAYKLHRHWWPVATLGTIVATALGVGAGFIRVIGKKFDRLDATVLDDSAVKTMAYTWLSLILVADMGITIVMTHGLFVNKTGWQHTDSHLKGLMVKCFEAQIPALLIAVITLVSWNQRLEIAILFLMMHTKVYTIGLLVTLNFRARHGTSTAAQSYNTDTTSGSYGMSHMPGKYFTNGESGDPKLGAAPTIGHRWRSDQEPKLWQHWDVESGRGVQSWDTAAEGEARRPSSPHSYQTGWGSTAVLNEVPLAQVRGGGGLSRNV